MLLRRALDLRTALKLGVQMDLSSIPADEFRAMHILEEEEGRLDRERPSQPL